MRFALLPLIVGSALWAFSQADWTALDVEQTGTPPGPAHPGTFEYRITRDPPKPEKIEFRWKPPPGGAPCAVTVLVQTVKLHFVNEDGSIESLGKKSAIWNGVDIDAFPDKVKDKLNDDKKKDEQALDPDATDDGTFVDHTWSEQDAPLNGNDFPSDQGGGKGSRTRPTVGKDAPEFGDGFFTGNRKKYVAEFETCAYCFDPATGQLGQVLGCMKWRYEREEGAAGTVIVPNERTGLPSPSHIGAVNKFRDRHRFRLPDGTWAAFCPEKSDLQINEEIKNLQEAARELEGEVKAAVLRQIAILTEQIRRRRGRRD